MLFQPMSGISSHVTYCIVLLEDPLSALGKTKVQCGHSNLLCMYDWLILWSPFSNTFNNKINKSTVGSFTVKVFKWVCADHKTHFLPSAFTLRYLLLMIEGRFHEGWGKTTNERLLQGAEGCICFQIPIVFWIIFFHTVMKSLQLYHPIVAKGKLIKMSDFIRMS